MGGREHMEEKKKGRERLMGYTESGGRDVCSISQFDPWSETCGRVCRYSRTCDPEELKRKIQTPTTDKVRGIEEAAYPRWRKDRLKLLEMI